MENWYALRAPNTATLHIAGGSAKYDITCTRSLTHASRFWAARRSTANGTSGGISSELKGPDRAGQGGLEGRPLPEGARRRGRIHSAPRVTQSSEAWVEPRRFVGAACRWRLSAPSCRCPGAAKRRVLPLKRHCRPNRATPFATARWSAARARRRVESSVGSGEFASLTISGISVQPSTTASQPACFMRSMTRS